MSEEKKAVYISNELYSKAEEYVKSSGGFASVEELIEFMLKEIIEEERPEEGYNKEEEEEVKERLRSLGYL